MINWQSVVVDVAVVISVTVLAALKILPGEAVIGILGLIAGARAAQRGARAEGKTLPPGATMALLLGVGAWVGLLRDRGV